MEMSNEEDQKIKEGIAIIVNNEFIKFEPHKKIVKGLTLLIEGQLDEAEDLVQEYGGINIRERIIEGAIKESLQKTKNYLEEAEQLSYFPEENFKVLMNKYCNLDKKSRGLFNLKIT